MEYLPQLTMPQSHGLPIHQRLSDVILGQNRMG
jgi:hypothetical protein